MTNKLQLVTPVALEIVNEPIPNYEATDAAVNTGKMDNQLITNVDKSGIQNAGSIPHVVKETADPNTIQQYPSSVPATKVKYSGISGSNSKQQHHNKNQHQMQQKREQTDIQTKNKVDTIVNYVNQQSEQLRCNDNHTMNNSTDESGTKISATKENTIDWVQRSFGEHKEVMNVTLNHSSHDIPSQTSEASPTSTRDTTQNLRDELQEIEYNSAPNKALTIEAQMTNTVIEQYHNCDTGQILSTVTTDLIGV